MPSELSRRVGEKLDELTEEETGRKFGQLNIVTDVSELATGSIRIKFQPLSAYSPIAVDIGRNIRNTALSVDGVLTVRVECSGHMMDNLVDRLVNQETETPGRGK